LVYSDIEGVAEATCKQVTLGMLPILLHCLLSSLGSRSLQERWAPWFMRPSCCRLGKTQRENNRKKGDSPCGHEEELRFFYTHTVLQGSVLGDF